MNLNEKIVIHHSTTHNKLLYIYIKQRRETFYSQLVLIFLPFLIFQNNHLVLVVVRRHDEHFNPNTSGISLGEIWGTLVIYRKNKIK